jgi:hypothetical protein
MEQLQAGTEWLLRHKELMRTAAGHIKKGGFELGELAKEIMCVFATGYHHEWLLNLPGMVQVVWCS